MLMLVRSKGRSAKSRKRLSFTGMSDLMKNTLWVVRFCLSVSRKEAI